MKIWETLLWCPTSYIWIDFIYWTLKEKMDQELIRKIWNQMSRAFPSNSNQKTKVHSCQRNFMGTTRWTLASFTDHSTRYLNKPNDVDQQALVEASTSTQKNTKKCIYNIKKMPYPWQNYTTTTSFVLSIYNIKKMPILVMQTKYNLTWVCKIYN